MQQLLITGLLVICLLLVYITTISGEQGMKKEQQRAHQKVMEYVKDIDA